MRLLLFLAFCTAAYGQELGIVVSGTFLKEIGSRDAGVGTEAVGIGGRFVYGATRHLDLESELIIWPNNSATAGTWIQGLFGVKAGQRFDRFGLFAKVRPGFMHFRKDPFGASDPRGRPSFPNRNFAHSTEPSIDIGGVAEFYLRRGLILRFDLGDTVLHYGHRTVVVSQVLPPIEAAGFTTHNWQGSFGLGFRF
jgi:hypothetical protein